MVGRATIGRPWLLKEIASNHSWQADGATQRASLAGLLEQTLSFYGTATGLKIFRKHLAAWLHNSLHTSLPRGQGQSLLTVNDPALVFAYLAEPPFKAAA